MFNPRVYLLALKSLKERSFRSWITIFGIVVSVAVIFILLTLSAGLQNAVVELFEDFGTDRIYILPGSGFSVGLAAEKLDDSIISKIDRLGYFDVVIPGTIDAQIRIEYKNEERRVSFITGVPNYDIDKVASAYNFDTDLEEGRFFQDGERNVAVLGYNVANDEDRFFSKQVRARNSLYINGTKFEVVGIYKRLGTDDDNGIYIPLEDAAELFNHNDEYSYADAILKENLDMDVVKERLDRLLEDELGEDNYVILTPEGILRQINSVLGIITSLLGAIAAISMIVGAVGIANTMFTAILEREKEIGIMKSIGASNWTIMNLFMTESGLIGLAGGVAGVIGGILMSLGIAAIADILGYGNLLSIQISIPFILISLLFSTIVGLLSGILPSFLASRKKIVDVLRDA